jgi:hypothetical protein
MGDDAAAAQLVARESLAEMHVVELGQQQVPRSDISRRSDAFQVGRLYSAATIFPPASTGRAQIQWHWWMAKGWPDSLSCKRIWVLLSGYGCNVIANKVFT